jgi:hypothetical protein
VSSIKRMVASIAVLPRPAAQLVDEAKTMRLRVWNLPSFEMARFQLTTRQDGPVELAAGV